MTPDTDVLTILSFIKSLALEAGTVCKTAQTQLRPDHLEFKGVKDLVTETDKRVEAFLTDRIRSRFPDHCILAEESGTREGASLYRWVIDPIDGTTSFYHGQPFYAISIALEYDGNTRLAVVHAPALGHLFHAVLGRGAFLNDQPIQVSSAQTLTEAVMATGFACLRSGLTPNNLVHFNRIVPQLRDIRRFGSAAVDLCYVACGRLDGFWEMNLNLYDVAAGILMVTEAGGVVCDFSGHDHYPEQGIVAANALLSRRLVEQLI